MSKTESPPPDPMETAWMSREYLPLLASVGLADLLSGVLAVFEVYGRAVFESIWNATPATAQLKILSATAQSLSGCFATGVAARSHLTLSFSQKTSLNPRWSKGFKAFYLENMNQI